MSAIFGWTGRLPDGLLQSMYARLRHRGGDLDVTGTSGGTLLAATHSHTEPGVASDAQFAVAISGRLYDDGASTGREAAERLLVLCRGGGVGAIARLNGDFACAVWDFAARTLVLARDLLGVQPLYWTGVPGGIAFASEYKALLAVPEFDRTPDREGLQRIQYTKYLPMSGRVMFRSVWSVPPGSVVAVDPQGRARQLARAVPPPLAVREAPLAALEARVAGAFDRAMGQRLPGSGRVGVALSGGIDSIAVAFACARRTTQGTLHTFTAGSGPEDPEIRTAAQVSQRLGARHHAIEIPPRRIVEALPEVVWHLEMPIARSETVQLYELGRAARGVVDTLFTGAAADSLFAGMPNYKLLRLYELLPPLRAALHEFQSLTQTGYVPESVLGKLLTALYFRGRLPDAPRVLGVDGRPALTRLPPLAPEFLNAYLQQDIQEDTAQWIPKLERPLAASGLDFSSPFLDPEMIRVAFTVPERYKLRRWREKYVLRRALRAHVDPDLTASHKFPMRMRYDAAFADALDVLVARYLAPERIEREGLLDPRTLAAVRDYRRSGRFTGEGAMRAWTAVCTGIWAEQFLYGGGEPPGRSLAPAQPADTGLAPAAVVSSHA